MLDTLKKANAVFQHAGFLRVMQRALQRLLPPAIFDINQIVVNEITYDEILAADHIVPADLDLQHRWATDQDLDLLTCGGLTSEQIQKYLDAGGRAVITNVEGRMAAYYWAIPNGWINNEWLWLSVGPGQMWGAHHYVAPEFRGQKIAMESAKFAYKQFRSEGYSRSIGAIDSLNRSSRRVWIRDGVRLLGQVFYVRFVGLVLYRIGHKWGFGYYGGQRQFELSLKELEALCSKDTDETMTP